MNIKIKNMILDYNYERLSEWEKGDLIWLILEMQEELQNNSEKV